MIVVFTDFGLQGPYTGQMKAVLHQLAPAVPTIDLFADAPVGNPEASAYLLTAYSSWSSAAPQPRAVGILTGSLSACRPASMGAISSRRLPPCWRVVNCRLADCARMTHI